MPRTALFTSITLLWSHGALALQPAQAFLEAGASESFESREATELQAQADAEQAAAWLRLLPIITGRLSYTRNEEETTIEFPTFTPTGLGPFETTVIVPLNQREAILAADLPLIDLSLWSRIGAASASADAAEARTELLRQDVSRRILQRYYQVITAERLIDVAKRSIGAAEENARIATARKDVGAGTALDVDRAQAELERAKQALADAELLHVTGRRALESISTLAPAPGSTPADASLDEEAPLDQWLAKSEQTPAVRAADAEERALTWSRRATGAALLPFISASANNKWTNATGFSGKDSYWTAGVAATWRLDAGTGGAWRAQAAASRAAAIRALKGRQSGADQIFDAWHQIHAQIQKSRAARAQAAAADRARDLSKQLYEVGAGTQLDLIQAERDSFAAHAQRIQADGDLEFARALLRLSAGEKVTGTAVRSTTAP